LAGLAIEPGAFDRHRDGTMRSVVSRASMSITSEPAITARSRSGRNSMQHLFEPSSNHLIAL